MKYIFLFSLFVFQSFGQVLAEPDQEPLPFTALAITTQQAVV